MDGAYVYLLQCADASFYCGVTRVELETRLSQNQQGFFPTCYTMRRRPVHLVWAEHFTIITDAIAVERQIKGWSRAKKRALIAGDWERLKELSIAYSERPHPSTGSG